MTSSAPTIRQVEAITVDAGRTLRWLFVRITASDGIVGLGEASDSMNPGLAVTAVIDHFAPKILGQPALPATAWTKLSRVTRHPLSPGVAGFPIVTAMSAVEQALWDIVARRAELPLVQLLGGPVRESVELYANLNRGLADRSPGAFGEAARRAADAGFSAVKCAPFDDVLPNTRIHGGVGVRDGLKRVSAMKEAVPSDVAVLVDCHGRFDRATAASAVRSLEALEPGWIEEPMRWEDDPDGLAKVRSTTAVPIAAGELLFGVRAYDDLLRGQAVDVVMTDVKHCGGLAAVRSVAGLVEAHGAVLSLHNPAGPISALHSAHLSAALSVAHLLEYPFADDRAEAVERLLPGGERVEDGRMLLPDAPGIGADLDLDEVARLGEVRRVEAA